MCQVIPDKFRLQFRWRKGSIQFGDIEGPTWGRLATAMGLHKRREISATQQKDYIMYHNLYECKSLIQNNDGVSFLSAATAAYYDIT